VIHYIESLRHTDLPEIISDSIAFRQPEKEEYDIAGGMNLLFRLKSFEMAYPKIHVEPDFGKTKPSVLVIGDSFYWGLQNMEISKAFSKTEFWFYNNRGTAGALKELPLLTRVRMAEEIKNFDVLILIATESNLPDLGWGFIENTYTYYKGIDPNRFDEFLFQEEVGDIKALLKKDPKKMERIMEVAAKNHISVDSMLTLRATTRAKNNRINKK